MGTFGSRIRKREAERVAKEREMDLIVFGQSFHASERRPWWNPMKYIAGEFKVRRIDPRDMYARYRQIGGGSCSRSATVGVKRSSRRAE